MIIKHIFGPQAQLMVLERKLYLEDDAAATILVTLPPSCHWLAARVNASCKTHHLEIYRQCHNFWENSGAYTLERNLKELTVWTSCYKLYHLKKIL